MPPPTLHQTLRGSRNPKVGSLGILGGRNFGANFDRHGGFYPFSNEAVTSLVSNTATQFNFCSGTTPGPTLEIDLCITRGPISCLDQGRISDQFAIVRSCSFQATGPFPCHSGPVLGHIHGGSQLTSLEEHISRCRIGLFDISTSTGVSS